MAEIALKGKQTYHRVAHLSISLGGSSRRFMGLTTCELSTAAVGACDEPAAAVGNSGRGTTIGVT